MTIETEYNVGDEIFYYFKGNKHDIRPAKITAIQIDVYMSSLGVVYSTFYAFKEEDFKYPGFMVGKSERELRDRFDRKINY